jgi:hypothetical protein
MAKAWSPKDPSDERDYQFNWGDFLPDGETITDATVTTPDELELVAQSFEDTGLVTFRVAGGTVGTSYSVNCTVITTSGQKFNGDATLKIAERILK